MASSRLVECRDCGYRWESSASSPRCSQSECGRSRNVEPVEDDLDDEQDDNDDDGYTPAFKTHNVRTGGERSSAAGPSSSTSTSTDEDDEQDDEQDDDTPDPEDLADLDPEDLKPAIEATFGMVATRRGEHWNLDEDKNEAERLSEAYAPVANKYAPYVLKQHTELGLAAIVTFSVLGPRLSEDQRLKEQQQKAAEDTTDTGTVRQPTTTEADDDLTDRLDPDVEDETSDPATNGHAGGFANV